MDAEIYKSSARSTNPLRKRRYAFFLDLRAMRGLRRVGVLIADTQYTEGTEIRHSLTRVRCPNMQSICSIYWAL